MRLIILKDKFEIAQLLSKIMIDLVKGQPDIVLGLATGSSPIETYELLIADYQTNKTDWSHVKTFNLDEYVNLPTNHRTSYRYFMNEQLFKHLNIKLENTYLPSGMGDLTQNAQTYEQLLAKYGPIDFQILGIGTNGHIGFNEPGTAADSKTHVVDLTKATLQANQRFFKNINEVPKQAITMGIATILQAKTIVLIASGKNKAQAIAALIHGSVTSTYPCSFLQNHHNVVIIIDIDAGSLLEPPKTTEVL